jgi:hypothetical protein
LQALLVGKGREQLPRFGKIAEVDHSISGLEDDVSIGRI